MDIKSIIHRFGQKSDRLTQAEKNAKASSVLVAVGGKPKCFKVVVPERMARKHIACCLTNQAWDASDISGDKTIISEYEDFLYKEIQPGYLEFTFSSIQFCHYIADLIEWRKSSVLYHDNYDYELDRLRKQYPEIFEQYHRKSIKHKF